MSTTTNYASFAEHIAAAADTRRAFIAGKRKNGKTWHRGDGSEWMAESCAIHYSGQEYRCGPECEGVHRTMLTDPDGRATYCPVCMLAVTPYGATHPACEITPVLCDRSGRPRDIHPTKDYCRSCGHPARQCRPRVVKP